MTTWWNNNIENELEVFKEWVKGYENITKTYCRKYIANKGYKSIIDCGCGVATEYYGYKADNYKINYTGLDSCKYFVDNNKANGISMIEAELEETFPIPDDSFECVYCREVIEHLSYYEKAINEFIRIGTKEVLIAWFLYPRKEPDDIIYWKSGDLFHNIYDIRKMENFILSNPKVDYLMWEKFKKRDYDNENEIILHIFLKAAG